MNSDPGLKNNQYTSGGYGRSNLKKIIFIVVSVFFAITILALVLVFQSKPESQQSKYIKSATTAARKNTPNAVVTNIKVAGGFAIGFVSDPTSQGQSKSGNTIIFKVNNDGSMVQLAEGSSFGPLNLLGLGIPLETQANLTGSNLIQVKQNLANQCGYSNGAIGFIGFNGSFNPGEWQIDSSTLVGLEQKISNSITSQDTNMKPDMVVVCVSATRNNSNYTINKTTYISTFILQVQFVTFNGTLTTHTVTFSVGPNYYRSYTLDGHNI